MQKGTLRKVGAAECYNPSTGSFKRGLLNWLVQPKCMLMYKERLLKNDHIHQSEVWENYKHSEVELFFLFVCLFLAIYKSFWLATA